MQKKNFFHLEDNRVAQKLLQNTFKEIASFTSAQTLKEAEEIPKRKPSIDCFFIDLNLGNENGIIFLKKIRTMKEYDLSSAFLLTSTLTNNIAYKAMRAGANASFSKLTSPAVMREKVCNFFDHPHVLLIKNEFHEVECLTWALGDQFYQYCPDIKQSTCAKTPEDAEANMQKLLEAYVKAHNNTVFDTNSAGVSIHRLNL